MRAMPSAAVILMFAAPSLTAEISLKRADDHLQIETDALSVRINTKGYVSGTAAGGFVDKKTGARDLGFGLHIMDFLLAPGVRDDGYMNSKYHGKIAKHYVEGPQICTQAKELTPEIIEGKDFVAVKFHFTFNKPGKGYKAGSTWEQTLVFKPGLRYFFSAERITSVNDVDALFYRIDMPGHIKHKSGDSFEKIWLSYEGEIPYSEFVNDFQHDPRVPGEARRQARSVAGRHDARPGGGERGVVPSARLRLLHRGAAHAPGEGRRKLRCRLHRRLVRLEGGDGARVRPT